MSRFALPVALKAEFPDSKQLKLVNAGLFRPLEFTWLPTFTAFNSDAGKDTYFLQGHGSRRQLDRRIDHLSSEPDIVDIDGCYPSKRIIYCA